MSDNFKNVLEVRRENMKGQKARKDHYSTTTVSSSMPLATSQGRGKTLMSPTIIRFFVIPKQFYLFMFNRLHLIDIFIH